MERGRLMILVTVLFFAIILGSFAVASIFPRQAATSTSTVLSGGCTKPASGFLIIADSRGFNDSVDKNLTAAPWPLIMVKAGTNVTITVCNNDVQSHGFNIQHYHETPIESLYPGEVKTISFVADESGTFWIRCEIWCTIHQFMIYGQLRVV